MNTIELKITRGEQILLLRLLDEIQEIQDSRETESKFKTKRPRFQLTIPEIFEFRRVVQVLQERGRV